MSSAIAIGGGAVQAGQTWQWEGAKPLPLFFVLSLGCFFWAIPCPSDLSPQAWHLFAIFVATIVGLITKPLPVGAVVLCALCATMGTGTTSFEALFTAFSQSGIWLIVFSFFLAQGLIKSRLAIRISYLLMAAMGKSTLGLCYGLVLSEMLLAPFVPSLVARSAGIIFPIVLALSKDSLGGDDPKACKSTPGFLVLTALQGSMICSNLFLTAMAGNPLCTQMAADVGIRIDWNTWALAASVPGAFTLLTVPLLIYKLAPPAVKHTPRAPELMREKLRALGPLSMQEILTIGIFSAVLFLWIAGAQWGINSTLAAMMGLSALLLTGVLKWNDCLAEKTAWDTLFWLGALVALGGQLKALGFFDWLSAGLVSQAGANKWPLPFVALVLLYFYSHYFFASNIAHASSMFFAFLTAALQLGTPPMLAAFTLLFFNNLFGGLTHYASGPAPLYFGTGYVSLRKWWGLGLVIGTYNLAVWLFLGSLWWRYLGLW